MKKLMFLAVLALAAMGALSLAGASTAAKAGSASSSPRTQSSWTGPALVRQVGFRNYAGPNCPGKGWNCTAATRVLQIATDGGQNVAQCNTKPIVTPTSLACSITQSGRNNSASCVQTMYSVPAATETCTIVQTGTQNRAIVAQLIWQTRSTGQTATQNATVTQGPASGGSTSLNNSAVGQVVKQRIGGTSQDDDDQGENQHRSLLAFDPTQVQNAYQSAVVTQTATGTGTNGSQLLQSQRQREFGGVAQSQNADLGTTDCNPTHGVFNPNACANVSQTSDSGNNSNILAQLDNKLASTTAAGATQVQGNADGGQDGRVHQATGAAGKSTNQATQSKQWSLTAPSGASQAQHDPSSCCGFASQDGGTGNSDQINQSANLTASGDPFPSQAVHLTGESTQPTDTAGTCTITQTASVNGASTPNSDTESPCPFLLLQTECFTSEGSSCTPSDPVTEQGSPLSQLTLCAANLSAQQPVCSSTTDAFGGNTLQYTIGYTNGGTATARNVVVTDQVPASQLYQGCSAPAGASCTYSDTTRTVTFTLGDVAPGNSVSMSFTALAGCPGGSSGTESDVATGQATGESPAATSAPAVVNENCIA